MKFMFRHKSAPVLAAATVRFRLSLEPFQKYRLESRVICWDEKWVYMEQRFVMCSGDKDGAVAAIGLVKGGFLNKRKKEMVPTAEILDELNFEKDSPAFPPHIKSWAEAEDKLREVTANKKAA